MYWSVLKKEFALLYQTVLIQRKLTNAVVLGALSFVFENDQAHSLIAVFVSRPFFKAFIWSGSAARQSRVISVLTFGNGNGGVAKGMEFSGSTARRLASRIECLKEWERYIIQWLDGSTVCSRVDWRAAEPLEWYFSKLTDEPLRREIWGFAVLMFFSMRWCGEENLN